MHTTHMKKTMFLFAALALTIGVSCGGSGGGDGGGAVGGGPGGSTIYNGSFVAGNGSPAAGDVAAVQGGTNSNLVTVGVTLTGVNDVFGASFDVRFDPTKVSYVSYTAGTVLERGGDQPVYLVTVQNGVVRIGASRSSGAAGGVDVGQTETLINLTFSVNAAGASSFAFEDGRLQNDSAPPQNISGIDWFGGTFQAN